jgi:hypothetical protein
LDGRSDPCIGPPHMNPRTDPLSYRSTIRA